MQTGDRVIIAITMGGQRLIGKISGDTPQENYSGHVKLFWPFRYRERMIPPKSEENPSDEVKCAASMESPSVLVPTRETFVRLADYTVLGDSRLEEGLVKFYEKRADTERATFDRLDGSRLIVPKLHLAPANDAPPLVTP